MLGTETADIIPPCSEVECKQILMMLTGASLVFPEEGKLWSHWLFGGGAPLELSWDYFDQAGAYFDDFALFSEGVLRARIGGSLPKGCGETVTETVETPTISVSSHVAMISTFRLARKAVLTLTKNCGDDGCCTSITGRIDIKATARDTTDFNVPGHGPQWINVTVAPIRIRDTAVNDCFQAGSGSYLPVGHDFKIRGERGSSTPVWVPCGGGGGW